MKGFIHFITNRNTLLISAMFLGMFFNQAAAFLKDYIIYILAIVMCFSLSGLKPGSFSPFKKQIPAVLSGILYSYIIHGGLIILLAYLFLDDANYFYGMVVIAATPPGIAVIPFSHILKANVKFATIGLFGTYLSALLITPLIISLFGGGQLIDISSIALLMFQLVIVPMVISRILRIKKSYRMVVRIRGKAVDWGFALIIFSIVGINKDLILSDPGTMLIPFLILLTVSFLLGEGFHYIQRKRGLSRQIIIPSKLLLTIKSSGFAAVTALSLFGPKASVPAAVMGIIVLFYLVYLSLRFDFGRREA